MSEVLSLPSAEELNTMVYGEPTKEPSPEQTRDLGITTFEALVLDENTDTQVDRSMVTTGTKYTMPEGGDE